MSFWWLCSAIILIPVLISCESSTGKCSNSLGCINGICKSGQCDCNDPKYWWGNFCEFCRERHTSKETGNKPVISEGKEKSLPSKCAWLIEIDEPKNNRSIILNIDEFNGTSCGNRRLNIYDGSSVRSPLLAIVSDIISTGTRTQEKPLLQLRAKSGSAFIVLTGKAEKFHDGNCWFSVTYSFEEECSIKCGSQGLCTEKSSQTCDCDVGWKSSNCSLPTCPVPCNDSSCDVNTRKCNCTNGFTGESCNISDKRSFWSSPVANNQDLLDGVASHGMVVIGNYLWLYGGLSFSKGPLHTLARYNIKENTWEVIQASSELYQGPSARYGHSLVAFNNSLFLFGGVCQGVVSSETWIFDTVSSQWSMLDISNLINKPVGVTGHTATVVDNEMIVLFGYNPGQGYVNKIQVLGLVTKEWSFKQVTQSSARPTYGHTSIYDLRTGYIYIHGGYRMLNNTHHVPSSDTFYYHPKNNEWHNLQSSGVSRYLHSAVLVGNAMIVYGGRGLHGYPSQHLMVFDIDKKNWKIPSDSVVLETVSRYGHSAVEVNSVVYVFGGFRGNMMNSFLLYSLGDCLSPTSSLNCFKPLPSLLSSADISMSHNQQDDRCHLQKSCKECISVDVSCLWCESHGQCVSKAVYDVTFPYLQCMQVLERGTGTCPDLQCSGMKSCRDCHLLPGCGWCDDGSGTGIGRCMPGGNDGPFPSPKYSNSSRTCSLFTPQTCSKAHWNFIGCPACQCNGHSKCIRENSCIDCENNTTGTYCEKCAKGYFGDPKNGCKCSACQCTAHAKSKACDSSTGICQCVTMGVKGGNCDECDTSQGYYGNASIDGFCYFSFLVSSKTFMSFNLTGLKRLSFEYYPRAIKRSVKLDINWTKKSAGSKARVNLTTFFAVRPEDGDDVVYKDEPVTPHDTFQAVFHYHDYEFDHEDKFGVHGYVYDVESTGKSAILEISISQPAETIDLLEFFLTFFGCFLSLLFVAGIVWKVRNRYVNFILNRQRREERQKMASRPFAKVRILLHNDHKSFPGNIAVETLENNKASVLTVLMQLPGTEDGFSPIGQSGICFASVLGTHGDGAGTIPLGKATLIRTRKRCNGTCV